MEPGLEGFTETGNPQHSGTRSRHRMSIVLENVSFGYAGDHLVLRNIDCTIADGDLVLLVGRNGAGKSTLLKLLNGILKPGSGSITVNTLDTRSTPTALLAAQVS